MGNLAVRRIAQDTIGFLWIGTEDGLYRYDGGQFTRFDASSGLPSTWITDLLATPEDHLWVCTPQGLATRKGSRFEILQEESSGLPPGSCYSIARDAHGVIWVAHKEGLFFQRDNRFVRMQGFPAGPSTALASLAGPSAEIFAGGKGFVVHIRNYQYVRQYPVGPDSIEPVDSLAADRDGMVWAQSARKLFRLPRGSFEFKSEYKEFPIVSSRGVLSIDRGGRLWVPTDEGMSCRIGARWQHFGPKDGLPTDWTRYIFEDREGSLWIGSIGLHRLIGRGSWTSWTRTQGLPSDTIWDIHRSRKGDLWVATDKGLCLATPAGWKVLPGTERTVVRRIHEDHNGQLWLGLMPAAVLRYDPARNSLTRYGNSSGVLGFRVLCVEEDGEGHLWAATDGAGLLRYRPDRNDFVREEVPGGTPEETFRHILLDKKSRLWVTGENGLLMRNGGVWHRFGRRDGLLQDHVSYIAESSSGELWLAYFEPLGIAKFAVKNNKLQIQRHWGLKDGLASAKVYLLGEDANHDLWVGTGKGIDVLSNEGMLHFSRADGIAGDDIDAMAFLLEKDGAVFIGTSSGLSVYRSDAYSEQMQAPRPIFLNVSIGDRTFHGGSEPLKLPHKLNKLKFEYAVLSYLHEAQIEYGVRLKGLDTDWHISRSRDTRYPILAPGSYVFEVRCRMGSGNWSEPAAFSFEIQEAWWRTWPAIACWLVLIGSAIFGGFRWRTEHLRKRTRQLEELVSARTVELAMANADLERLSITDPLTGLKNRRFLEFSIAEDLARIRRSFQSMGGEWEKLNQEEAPNVSFLVIDIDHFKQVNDQLGHAAGDQVLRQMGAVLSSAVRESDTTVRWGGEEFLIIARNSRGSDPAALAERIRRQVESSAFGTPDRQSIRLTCSIGFASWPFFRHDPDALGWQDVLGLADRCLYLAKNSGRNAWMGLIARADYMGSAEYSVLNDLDAAESEGILEIRTSVHHGAPTNFPPVPSRQPSERRATL